MKVAYQATPAEQDVRMILRIGQPNLSDIGHWGIDTSRCVSVGGSDFAPWESSFTVGKPWGNAQGSDVVYVARVKGMSRSFVPHLIARLNLHLGEKLEHLELTGSAPLGETAITEAEVLPCLADLSTYPGQWPDLGFAVERVPSCERELGFQIELCEPLAPADQEKLQFMLIGIREVIETYANEKGKAVDPKKAWLKFMPPYMTDRRAQAYAGEVAHAHAPSCAAVLNMLASFHRRVAKIARVRVTSTTGAPQTAQKQDWATWLIADEAPKPPKPPALSGFPPYRTPAETALLPMPELLASNTLGPAVYAVLRAELHLEPLCTADIDGITRALSCLRDAIGDQLRYSVNSKGNSRVVRYQAKHFDNITAWCRTLLGETPADMKALVRMAQNGDLYGADVSFKGEGVGDDAAATASPWTVSYWADLEGVYTMLSFTVPLSFPLARFADLVAAFASSLRVRWGNAGFGYATWEYFGGQAPPPEHVKHHPGFDHGEHVGKMVALQEKMRAVSWLNLLGPELWSRLSDTQRDEVTKTCQPQQTGECLLIRAAPQPDPSGKDYAALRALLTPIAG